MSPIQSHASFATARCKRFTAYPIYNSEVQGFTLLTSNLRHAALTSTYVNGFDHACTL
jgi:hypothetical protein